MHWMGYVLFFQQMLKGLGEVQRLGRYFGNSGVSWGSWTEWEGTCAKNQPCHRLTPLKFVEVI